MAARLAPYGLRLFGDLFTRLEEKPCHLFLVGNGGREMWRVFTTSAEARDGLAHPLDRWTRRVLQPLGEERGARILFPFEGPPWHPFQRWAQQAGCGRASPLGILMHPRFGLWHGYRGAFAFPTHGMEQKTKSQHSAQCTRREQCPPAPHACDECREQPCLTACPVGAITASGLDVARCRAHILSAEGVECLTGGCLARRACPASANWRQFRPQQAFHMAAFAKGAVSM